MSSHQDFRIKCIAIGAILLIAGIFMASGGLGGSFLEWGYICSLIGIVSLTLGFSNQTKRDEDIAPGIQTFPTESWHLREFREKSHHTEKTRAFIKRGEYENARKEINHIPLDDFALKVELLAELARAYLSANNTKMSLETTEAIHWDINVKDTLFFEIANHCFKIDNDKENALKVILKIENDARLKETFLYKLSNACLEEKDKANALKVIINIKTFLDLLADGDALKNRIAQSYMDEKDYENAFEAILAMHNPALKKDCLTELFKVFENKKALEMALRIDDKEIRLTFLAEIADDYHQKKDEKGMLEFVKEILETLICSKMYEYGGEMSSRYRRINTLNAKRVLEEKCRSVVHVFYTEKALSLVEGFKKRILEKRTKSGIREIMVAASRSETVEAFLNLEQELQNGS